MYLILHKSAYRVILLIVLLCASSSFAQTVNIGLKLESLNYFYKNTRTGYHQESLTLLPLSAYLKASVIFNDRYEVEIKGGIQLDELFAGPECALSVKYDIGKGVCPLLTYMIHFNGGDARNLNGTYATTFNFIGAGIELKITKVFGMNLIYYVPVGDNRLTYSGYFVSTDSGHYENSTSNIVSIFKLGFIFNITL